MRRSEFIEWNRKIIERCKLYGGCHGLTRIGGGTACYLVHLLNALREDGVNRDGRDLILTNVVCVAERFLGESPAQYNDTRPDPNTAPIKTAEYLISLAEEAPLGFFDPEPIVVTIQN